MSTIQTQNSASTTGRVAWNRLWLMGLIAIVVSTIVNVIIRMIALAVLPIPTGSMQLHTPTYVIAFTIIGVLLATIVFAIINRSARQPIRTFRIVATIVLLLTFIPDFAILSMGPAQANIASVATLLVMHTVTYFICVGLLTSVAPAK